MRNFFKILILVLPFGLIGCENNKSTSITITNPLNSDRLHETIELNPNDFQALIDQYGYDKLAIFDQKENKLLVNQWMDTNGDGKNDVWLFQTNIQSMETLRFNIRPLNDGEQQPTSTLMTYSRFVPERTDDYAWENDRVAFRTYGPDAQRRVEQKLPQGTLTSGIDAWLKKVDYPIINKWYSKYVAKTGSYHKDTGEGYDPYHVGISRGIGGIGFWNSDTLFCSKNFSSYKKIAEGPIRTMFELNYEKWFIDGDSVAEKKIISLDLGSNLCHFQSHFTSDQPLPPTVIGITLHNKKGESNLNIKQGYFSYWEKIDQHMLGTGIVINPHVISDARRHEVDKKDLSHLYVITQPNQKIVDYYAGFGWEGSQQFQSKEEWNSYLNDFAIKTKHPLQVTVE
ncbi:DUF4861 family protein [Flammeovirga pacifica]|uniref:DUF4861 domain-containing protein n=1 Tax=Flammeovirga pacifica TaxID=915059 RepID=A0A1S1YU51_FLAPC|nr:DUF4861 family protein [Flammeovirga pacifica]OHX64536.1 DUF4861 domain-containing protein [Flammeovirga pacifica]